MKRDSKIGARFQKISRPVRTGLIMGCIVGLTGSFFLLMAASGLLSAYIFLGPMAAVIAAVLGAAAGSLVSPDGSKEISRAMFHQFAGLLVLFGGLCIGAFFLIHATLNSIGGINGP